MKQIYFLTTVFFLLIGTDGFSQIRNRGPINLSDPNEINYLQPKDYIIAGVTITGAQYLVEDVLLTISKLTVGDYIEVPREATANVIKNLMEQNLFEDVQLWANRIDGENIYLEIKVQERPRLTRIDINGLSKSQTEEIKKRLNEGSGRIVNENLIQSTRATIKRFLREKSFLYPDIKITTKKDTAQPNNEIVEVDVDRNKKIKVREVNFSGNEVFSDKQLTKYLKGIKPRK